MPAPAGTGLHNPPLFSGKQVRCIGYSSKVLAMNNLAPPQNRNLHILTYTRKTKLWVHIHTHTHTHTHTRSVQHTYRLRCFSFLHVFLPPHSLVDCILLAKGIVALSWVRSLRIIQLLNTSQLLVDIVRSVTPVIGTLSRLLALEAVFTVSLALTAMDLYGRIPTFSLVTQRKLVVAAVY